MSAACSLRAVPHTSRPALPSTSSACPRRQPPRAQARAGCVGRWAIDTGHDVPYHHAGPRRRGADAVDGGRLRFDIGYRDCANLRTDEALAFGLSPSKEVLDPYRTGLFRVADDHWPERSYQLTAARPRPPVHQRLVEFSSFSATGPPDGRCLTGRFCGDSVSRAFRSQQTPRGRLPANGRVPATAHGTCAPSSPPACPIATTSRQGGHLPAASKRHPG
jgi:hypothetical protein